jgi:protein-S-isoprenylcysteine O-methyltransferase Ste14
MTSPKSSPASSPEAAAAGPPDHPDLPVKPPVIFVIAMGIGFAAHWMWPVSVRPPGWWGFGVLLVAFGLTLVQWSALHFRRHDTEIFPWLPTRVIVTSGPYAHTRNPIYLGLALVQLGIGLWADRLAVVLMVIPAVAATNAWIIAREETYLDRKFGEEYRGYLQRVRRWI